MDTLNRVETDHHHDAAQDDLVRQNISAVVEMQRRAAESQTRQDQVADGMTAFSGSMIFVYLHAVWFGLWILLNTGLLDLPHITQFDPYPFGLLTLIVSLEAIFLSTFVLISQNRMAQLSERRAELDLQINLLAEQKAAKVLEMLDRITDQLNEMDNSFHLERDPEVEMLKVSPSPQEVLQVIDKTVDGKTEEVKQEIGQAKEAMADGTERARK